MRKKINMSSTIFDAVVDFSEGNPGSCTVLSRILKDEPPVEVLSVLLDLDDMNIRGPQIWVAYKDYCGEDLVKFRECVRSRDRKMVDVVNAEMLHDPRWSEIAVTNGASWER